MSLFKEIGGYFELESYGEPLYHSNAIYLNSCRNALKYLVRANEIKEIYLPTYNCIEVLEAIKPENCVIKLYNVDKNFNPLISFPNNAYVVYINYCGVSSTIIDNLRTKNINLILDNTHAFFDKTDCYAKIYSPRKTFGLPDSGIIVCSKELNYALEEDISYDRCKHLLKRHDLGANLGYNSLKENESLLGTLPILKMSKLTFALMGNINYTKAKKKRVDNFNYLHSILKDINEYTINIKDDDVPFVYPLLIKNDELRKKLIDNKIYIPTYWPSIEDIISDDEAYLQKYLLPLPIDQRYGIDDMKRIVEVINE